MFGQSQDSCDFLQLRNQPKFKVHLQSSEEVVLSTSVNKYNGEGKCQQRILVVTNMAILNILKAENIIKSFMKKFINMSNRYEIKRRILLQNLYGITISPNKTSNVFLIHVLNGHDYHYRAQNNKMTIIKVIAQQYRKLTKKNLNFYFKDQMEIVNFCMTKVHLKEKKDVRPKDNAIILNEDYFSSNQFENQIYVCEYSSKGEGILPKNFKKVQPAKIKPGCSYYIMKEEYNRSIKVQNLYKNNHLLIPQFSFYSDKKQLLFTSFISGGDLKKFIAKQLPLSRQNTIFYVSQLLLFVKQLHSIGKIYSNITLENIYVKENGYLILNGLEKSIQDYQALGGKLLYRVSGNPCYFPPQVIECRGYDSSIDIWKIGVCAYIFLTGRYPFEGRSVKELYQQILFKSLEQEQIPEFVKRMLQKNRQKRISIEDLLNLDIFSGKSLLGIQSEQQKAYIKPEITLWTTGSPPVIYQLEEE